MPLYTAVARVTSSAALDPLDEPPIDFDAVEHPIISRHWFGVIPSRSIGEDEAEVVADLRFRRKVQRLHGLGPRVLAELLAEIAAERNIRVVVERKLDRFTNLDPGALNATGGDHFPPTPLHTVAP